MKVHPVQEYLQFLLADCRLSAPWRILLVGCAIGTAVIEQVSLQGDGGLSRGPFLHGRAESDGAGNGREFTGSLDTLQGPSSVGPVRRALCFPFAYDVKRSLHPI